MPSTRFVRPARAVLTVMSLMLLALAPAAEASKGDCGQPVTFGSGPTATDALGVLRAAVGTNECLECVCDVDRSGTTQASDALRTLRFAVGTIEALNCLACRVEKTIGTAGGLLQSADDRVFLNISEGQLSEATELSVEEIPVEDLPPALAGIAERAYLFGPDDLEFNALAELDVIVDGDAAAVPGELSAQMALLFTADGGTVELLPVQQLFIDGDNGRITAGAAISHFTQLAIVRADVTVSLASIPDSSEVDVEDSVDASVVEGAGETLLQVESAAYTDNDFGAWAPVGGDIVNEPLEESMPRTFEDSFTYACTSQAATIYRPQVRTTFDITASIAGEPQDVSHLTVFETTVLCEQ